MRGGIDCVFDQPMTAERQPETGKAMQAPTLRDLVAGLGDGRDKPAILAVRKDGIETWSYATLADRAARMAGVLAAAGIGPGDRVALFAAHSAEWIVAALATISAGATLVPVDPQSDPRSLAHIVQDCGASFWFTSSQTEARLRERAPGDLRSLRLDSPMSCADLPQRPEAPQERPPLAGGQDDIAVMFYTSGTTGVPKGVPLSHRNLLFQVETLRCYDLAAASVRVLLALPLHHVYPFSIGLLGVLAHEGAIVVARALTGPEILRALRDGAVTAIVGVPRLFEVFVTGIRTRAQSRGQARAALLSGLLRGSIALRRSVGVRAGRHLFRRMLGELGTTLQVVVSGGAALDADLAWTMDAFGWTVSTGYGLTETSPLLALLPPGDTRFDSVGKPVPKVDIRIVPLAPAGDDVPGTGIAGKFRLPPDIIVGEVQARGPGIFAGYHNLPDKTAAAFTPDGWFRTEDLGYLDRRGYLHILGRQTTLIVTPAGENIQPETIEAQLVAASAIREAGVLQRDGRLVAVVVPDFKDLRRRGPGAPEDAVRQAIAEAGRELPSHHRLAHYVIGRDALPRTRLGKIRRAELERRYVEIESGRAGQAQIAPEALSDDDKALLDEPAARVLWDWLQERFPDQPLSPDASLALDLGVDSLEWVNVTLEIRQRAGIEISEEATARIETVRDLLTEAVAAESSELAATAASLADQPERFISPAQARWLRPLSPAEQTAARLLYRLNKWGMKRLFRLDVIGRENLPSSGNFIIAPNHASFLDPFVVAAALDYDRLRQTCMAGWTGMAFANRLFRLVSRLARALPIEVDRAAFSSLAMSLVVLKRGNNLVWFPEGGRSRDGLLQPFLTGISLLLQHQPVPVVPVRITGTFEAMPIGRRLPRLRPLTVEIGRPLTVDDLEKMGQGTARQQRVADGLREAVRSIGRPTSG